jgi:hypothetical protein
VNLTSVAAVKGIEVRCVTEQHSVLLRYTANLLEPLQQNAALDGIHTLSYQTMRSAAGFIALCVLTACNARERQDKSPKIGADSAFRYNLLDRVARDQAVRDTLVSQLRTTGAPTPALIASLQHVDSSNLAWIKPRLQTTGFPTPDAVGRDGVQAAFLLVQHADADPAFQAEMLPLLQVAFERGDVAGQEIALLTDRVAKAQGRAQPYGTQTTIRDGVVIFDPIADSANVDARRQSLGLPTLADYKRLLDSIYKPRRSP